MKLESTEMTYLNNYSQQWSMQQKDGSIKDGTTFYVTTQDPTDGSINIFKLDKDYIFPNQLKSGAHIKILFNYSKFGRQVNLTVIGVHVIDNQGFN